MKFKIIRGFFLGVLANVVGMYLYVYFFAPYEVETIFTVALEQGFLGGIIGLGAILNLVLFFFFLTTRIFKFKKAMQPYEARGVLMATILAALAVMYFEF